MEEQFPIKMMNEDDTKNWTKVGLAFYQAKDALVHIVEAEWTKHHTRRNQKPASETDIYYLLKYINENKEVYTDREFQKAAKKVRDDRNDYIHQLPKAKVTDKQLEKWTGDMLCLLKLVEKPELAGTASHAMERIEKIRKTNYEIVQEDERMARLSNLEGEIVRLECIVQTHEEGLKSIKDCLQDPEYSGVDSTLGGIIKRKIDKVETDLKESMSSLESTVEEVKDKVDYLMENDPEQRAVNYVQQLTGTDEWDSRSDFAISKLLDAYKQDDLKVVRLLHENGVRLSMQHLSKVVVDENVSVEIVEHLINHLKENNQWEANSEHASDALDIVFSLDRQDLISLLQSEDIRYRAEESAEEIVNLSDLDSLKSRYRTT